MTQAGGSALGLARDVYDLTAGNAIQAGKGKDAHVGRMLADLLKDTRRALTYGKAD